MHRWSRDIYKSRGNTVKFLINHDDSDFSVISCIAIETARKVISLTSSTLLSVKLEHVRFVVAFHHYNFATNVNTLLRKVDINTCGHDLLFSISFDKVTRDRL